MKGLIRTMLGACLSLPIMATGTGSPPVQAGTLSVPPIPSQPAPPQGDCATPSSTTSPWTSVYSETSRTQPSFQLAVDPEHPCRIYRASSPQAIDRSLDGGRTWRPLFRDSASLTPATPQLAASGMYALHGGGVVMAERGNGDAALASGDAGRSWKLMNNGLEFQPVQDITVAPGFRPLQSGVAYATVEGGACAVAPGGVMPGGSGDGCGGDAPSVGVVGLYVTVDGGQTWTPAVMPSLPALTGSASADCSSPCVRRTQIAIDPAHPDHFWMLLSAVGNAPDVMNSGPSGLGGHWPPSVIAASGDYGRTYTVVDTPLTPYVSQIIVTRTPRHGLRLYTVTPGVGSGAIQIYPNGAGPATVVNGTRGSSLLATDPVDGDRMLYIAWSGRFAAMTLDGFDTVIRVPNLPGLVGVPQDTDRFLQIATPLERPATRPSAAPSVVLQADDLGDFYVAMDQVCDTPQCRSATPGLASWHRQSYWRYASAASGGGTLPQCSPGSTCLPTQQGTVQGQLLACPVPPDLNGSMAYDGHELLYTRYRETGPSPNQGVVHMVSPTTCLDTPMLVDFRPQDVAAAATASGCALSPPNIDDMTYDQRRNVIWASLADTSARDPAAADCSIHGPYLFRIEVTDRSSIPLRGTARLALFAGCNDFLTYDVSDDTLWTCTGSTGGYTTPLGHVRAATGQVVPSCVSRGTVDGTGNVATWLAAPPYLLLWDEDDMSVEVVDPVTCRTVRILVHRRWVEAPAEEEQMACDPLTYGSDSSLPIPVPATTVLWARDEFGALSATALPPGNGTCPLPTSVTVTAPTRVPAGAVVPVCSELRHNYPAGSELIVRGVHLTDTGVSRNVVGARGEIGWMQTTTSPSAPGCVHWMTPLDAGVYRITVAFAGDTQYLPSTASTVLTVIGDAPVQPRVPPALGSALPPLPATVTPLPVPQPGPASQTVPQVQAQIQVQSQAEVQSQMQAQSQMQSQPAVMTARRKQLQMAGQAASTRQQAVMAAARARYPSRVTWAAALVSSMLLGLLGAGARSDLQPARLSRVRMTRRRLTTRTARGGRR